jgi:hypothetical protein
LVRTVETGTKQRANEEEEDKETMNMKRAVREKSML